GSTTDTTFSGVISGAGNLTKVGSGTLTLSGTNAYTGTTTVSAGTLLISNDAGLGDTIGGTTVHSGGTLDLYGVVVGAEQVTLNGGTLKDVTSLLAGNVILTADSTISTDTGNTLILSGVVSGGYGITKTGAGSLVLTNTNTYTGTTTISAGTLSLTGTGSIASSSSIINNATLNISGTAAGTSIISLAG
ncbi:autotransporter-associated beta strand repeat-containing protein, partial [Polynucleobacter sp. MWH-Jannik1A5]|uniref:autotransporter-associated beta strand repeat-containing protein n=1 Tax=Polynucleobacter sp. MWH-Jannik1A5 TaxID=1855890 RepID=UPI001C0BE0F5